MMSTTLTRKVRELTDDELNLIELSSIQPF